MAWLWAFLMFPINDVTTTPERPPLFREINKLDAHKNDDLSYKSQTRERQQRLYPDLAPLNSPLSSEKLFRQAVQLVKQQAGWKIIDTDEANFRLEIVAISPVLKLPEDVVLEVRPEARGSTLHMRSKSRVSTNDLGGNYKRIQAFLKLLQ